jgi:two-component system, cell cycle sensor histidine kinase and response regulator CckA
MQQMPVRRILILEDDILVRDVIRRMLQTHNFEVVETGDGHETIRQYQEALQHGRPFDLVILDLTIPEGLSGAETIHYLRQLDPHLLAVVSSGYRDDPLMKNYQQYGFAAALPKPYQREALLQLVNGVLAVQGRGARQ